MILFTLRQLEVLGEGKVPISPRRKQAIKTPVSGRHFTPKPLQAVTELGAVRTVEDVLSSTMEEGKGCSWVLKLANWVWKHSNKLPRETEVEDLLGGCKAYRLMWSPERPRGDLEYYGQLSRCSFIHGQGVILKVRVILKWFDGAPSSVTWVWDPTSWKERTSGCPLISR